MGLTVGDKNASSGEAATFPGSPEATWRRGHMKEQKGLTVLLNQG
jgi:hypothetical protein